MTQRTKSASPDVLPLSYGKAKGSSSVGSWIKATKNYKKRNSFVVTTAKKQFFYEIVESKAKLYFDLNLSILKSIDN